MDYYAGTRTPRALLVIAAVLLALCCAEWYWRSSIVKNMPALVLAHVHVRVPSDFAGGFLRKEYVTFPGAAFSTAFVLVLFAQIFYSARRGGRAEMLASAREAPPGGPAAGRPAQTDAASRSEDGNGGQK